MHSFSFDIAEDDWELRLASTIDTPGHIKGITVLEDRIFIVRRGTPHIEEYKKESIMGSISVSELREPIDLVSCKKYKKLYISDSGMKAVHTYHMTQQSASKWSFETAPGGSVGHSWCNCTSYVPNNKKNYRIHDKWRTTSCFITE